MQPGGPGDTGVDIEFLPEAALVVDLDGRVRSANSAARALLGDRIEGAILFDAVEDDTGDVAAYLRRAGSSTASRIGALTLARNGDRVRFRALAARLRRPDTGDDPAVILRLMPVSDDQFSVLNRRIRQMDQLLHRRMKENAMLQEALAENRVLVRELQHRVKNNIHQILSLIRMSAAQRRSPEVADMVATASRRLQAMAVAQEALYQNAHAGAISAGSFIEDVVRGAAAGFGGGQELSVEVDEGRMTSEEAHCLALIVNELVTNACKHGHSEGCGPMQVTFRAGPDGFHLCVRDRGPGFDPGTTGRSSGLSLVKGLCRQIGGRFEVSNDGGTVCSIHFRSDLAQREGEQT